jgi:hypothetical protein
MRWRAAGERWLARYGVAEVFGIAGAVVGAWIVSTLTDSTVLTAYAGTTGENVGYYGFLMARELAAARRARQALSAREVIVACRDLAIEFGPAEILDSLFVRPLMMGLGTRRLGGGLGIIAGKLAADVLFYLPVIASYEARRVRRATPPR